MENVQFLFECQKVTAFASTMVHHWLAKISPFFHLIRSFCVCHCSVISVLIDLLYCLQVCFAIGQSEILLWFWLMILN